MSPRKAKAQAKHAADGAITNDFHPTPEGPVTTTSVIDHQNDVERAFADKGVQRASELPQTEPGQPERKIKPYKDRFTSSAAGVYYGEDFLAKELVFRFDNDRRPDDEDKTNLKAIGYRYNAQGEWVMPPSGAARLDSMRLAAEITEKRGVAVEQGQSR